MVRKFQYLPRNVQVTCTYLRH